MIDAPLDDMDWDPQPQSPRQVQDRERSWDGLGCDVVTTLALAPDGAAAGASQLLVSRLRPPLGRQADTGVVTAHRGHGLGRWLKAENLRRAREHEPALAVVETYNAESNPHMLAINVEMGFRPHHTFSTYQGSVAEARAALSAGAAGV
jgi:mycothiol synthase